MHNNRSRGIVGASMATIRHSQRDTKLDKADPHVNSLILTQGNRSAKQADADRSGIGQTASDASREAAPLQNSNVLLTKSRPRATKFRQILMA
jgi:hypothetical protein